MIPLILIKTAIHNVYSPCLKLAKKFGKIELLTLEKDRILQSLVHFLSLVKDVF